MKDVKRRKVFKTLKISLIIFAAFIFIIFVNLASTQNLPPFLQKGANALNTFSGNLIYRPYVNTSGLEISFIDVGQGDCELISCGGENMIIDAGTPENGSKIKNYILTKGITNISYVVCTHPHNDHIGGMDEVINNFSIDEVLLSPAKTTTQTYENLLLAIQNKKIEAAEPKSGYTATLGGAEFTVFSPEKDYDDLNNMSLIIKLTYKNNSFLFMGDAGIERESELLSQDVDLSADVIKIGHHGSKTATSQAFLTKVHPSYAVISVGSGNSYGLPDCVTTQLLKDADINIFRTDLNGTVTATSDGNKIQFKEEKCSGNFK